MVKDKPVKLSQSNTIVQYTISGQDKQKPCQDALMPVEREGSTQGTAEILEAIRGSREALEMKMDTMAMDVNHLRLDVQKVAERVTTVAEEVASLQTTVQELQAKVATLEGSTGHIVDRLEDAEGRSMTNKIITIEPAHTMLEAKPKPGAPPRAIIARLFTLCNRDSILQYARLRRPPKYEQAPRQIFPDYIKRVQDLCKSFLGVKRRMRDTTIGIV
ncbi:hypothetical protein NDU88_001479 [Pleurodeles waltl]|uniref:Uncharacterized protein n=1 Tax=Pleurodeles waltl TaxID=8319 RepID=A0AAV7U8I7_PLEWA|nr:hypothetical protein NDU88_001479 [Pleurodeles waltl]